MSSRITYITGFYELSNSSSNFEKQLENASKLSLKIPHPMIIFCEPDKYAKIKEERNKYGYLTHYVVKKREDLEYYQHLAQIIDNRKTRPRADPNNTPEYQLITCSKFTMVRDAINKNIFGSQYYTWIDFGLEETEYSNIEALRGISSNIISNKRENVRMCFIGYTSKEETLDLEKYYNQHGRCGITGLFFSGSSNKLLRVMEMCNECFKDTIMKGYGHADEQIYLQVLFKYILEGGKIKDLFDFYFGDYQYVLSNYQEILSAEAKHTIMNVFLPNASKDKAIHNEISYLVKQAVMYIMNGYKKERIDLNKDEIIRLFECIS